MIDLSRVAMLDVESSGLHDGSYPIEVGFVRPLPDLPGTGKLIRPHDGWGEELWSVTSEGIHNISRETLFSFGDDVTSVASFLNEELAESIVYSDAEAWDGMWLRELYRAAGIRMQFSLDSIEALYMDLADEAGLPFEDFVDLRSQVEAEAELIYPHIHRAEADARGMAAAVRALAVPDFRQRLAEQVAAKQDQEWEMFADR